MDLRTGLALWALTAGCGTDWTDPSRELGEPVADTAPHAEVIAVPKTVGVVDTPLTDVNGTPIGVSCRTCHGPDPDSSWAARPGEPFHTKVELKHGDNVCNSCHDPEDRTRLHLADGTPIEFGESIRLCAQCHGPQWRDYQHGAHGGMNGYWDRRRGGRTRHHCAACHAPHTPAYGQVLPVHPPRDRYLEDGHE